MQLDFPSPIYPSADLRSFAFEAQDSFGDAPLATKNAGFLQRPDGTVTWLSRPTVENPVAPTSQLRVAFAGGSPDLSTIYLGYPGAIAPEDFVADPAVEGRTRGEIVATGLVPDMGLYEWHDGTLQSAGILPNGFVDPYGAIPAATQSLDGFANVPGDYANNQVSSDGSRLTFVSPEPGAGAPASDPSELYIRLRSETGPARTILVSRSEVTGEPAVDTPRAVRGPHTANANNGSSYAYVSPDGSRVFFQDIDSLTSDAPNDGSLKVYEFDVASETLHFLPGFGGTAVGGAEVNTSPIVASSRDGSVLLFVRNTEAGQELDLWNGQISLVTPLPVGGERLVLAPTRGNADGSTFVFQTNAPLPGEFPGQFNNDGIHEEIYRYEVGPNKLDCLLCPPTGKTPSGSAHMSNSTGLTEVVDSRGVSADLSRVFFDTPDSLLTQDTNTRRDVYEWEAGALNLISGGRGGSDSFLLDNSESGDDVFFATVDALVPRDQDGGYDVYDARVNGGLPEPISTPGCTSSCGEGSSAPPGSPFGAPGSTTFVGPGNAPPPVTPPLTAAQIRAKRLASALRACHAKRHRARVRCEASARKRYGVKHRGNKTKKKAKR